VGGGMNNTISTNAFKSVLVGGGGNSITSDHCFLGGGLANTVSGEYGTVPGGDNNVAAVHSFAAGHFAQASTAGTFVWADVSSDTPFTSTLNDTFIIRAINGVGIGTSTPQAQLDVNGTARVKVLQITGGADVAEPFDLTSQNVPAGSVLVIDADHPGQLAVSRRAYDKCVAGIVSGANGVNPGLTLSQQALSKDGRNVALSGRVYTLADATKAPIKPGDLLTTSAIEGHAMKASNSAKAQGAILGKAMSSLNEGQGYVLVLVTLQ